ncbi:aspartate/tyrosine/aromatic aminotransferase [Sphingomonas sp. MMSM20]|uniref:amino acid aminotransferase n=1 Tax=Sphingomonas lycopersici TaxID=2951807 RepID=UPI0022376B72|nr:amino acid aminotransferase [Sphingomonas lycopersici]MCW6529871.1 aspartate/tyrosine/aromatic aminotransferase [Sphingomonas lycopersici]
MFAELPEAPIDPILGMAQAFASDPSPNKVDLGIGIYKDERGEVIVLPTVKAAERALHEGQMTKRYLSSAGNPEYNERTRGLLFREGSDAHSRARTIQTVGGTGALRVAADFIRKFGTGRRIFLPDPTWANHPAIFGVTGFEIVNYPYYDIATGTLRLDAMMSALADLKPGDTVLLHGCCHNPAGADPTAAQWAEIGDLVARSGATALVDLAYLGFAEGLEEDRQGLAILAERLPEMIVASSYSKNFALYRERTGALTLVGANASAAERAMGNLLPVVRTNYSMPPDHGAAIVAHILGDATLRAQWEEELAEMRNRIRDMRHELVRLLAGNNRRDYSFLAGQHGMFAMLGISPDAVKRLREDWHVHITGSSRANIAGLTPENVAHVAEAIAAVS